jgi:hypothetical protein
MSPSSYTEMMGLQPASCAMRAFSMTTCGGLKNMLSPQQIAVVLTGKASNRPERAVGSIALLSSSVTANEAAVEHGLRIARAQRLDHAAEALGVERVEAAVIAHMDVDVRRAGLYAFLGEARISSGVIGWFGLERLLKNAPVIVLEIITLADVPLWHRIDVREAARKRIEHFGHARRASTAF